ncbi:ATP-binding cassette domain-containing protein [Micromonospora sp. GCM10011542]|uniref:ATP-binding cassette domain-containing protein n=1 Tax=Micromonospora sp. GCM10011542 TaxID=3317337 RepID=UPI0036138AA9
MRADGETTAGRGAVIRVADLVKRFRSGDGTIVGVDRVTLQVPAGATVAVTGPSGSQKSTLLHLIGAIERADEGRIEVDDVEVTGLSGRRLAHYLLADEPAGNLDSATGTGIMDLLWRLRDEYGQDPAHGDPRGVARGPLRPDVRVHDGRTV